MQRRFPNQYVPVSRGTFFPSGKQGIVPASIPFLILPHFGRNFNRYFK